MRNTIKSLGIVVLAAAIGLSFSFYACDTGSGGNDSGNGGNDNGGNGNSGGSNTTVISCIAYGNGIFVAGTWFSGAGVTMAYSADGVDWTAITNQPFGNGMIDGIAWGAGKFVAVGSKTSTSINNVIAYSADGINWTEATDSPYYGRAEYVLDVVWGGDKFVAAGSYYGNNNSGMVYSADGVTWTAVPNTFNALGSSGVIEDIGWCNDRFIAATTFMAYSANGIDWSRAPNNPFGRVTESFITTTGSIYDYAWGNGKFVAVGFSKRSFSGGSFPNEGKIAFSSDAVNWGVADGTFDTDLLRAVAWGNGRFVAGGGNGRIVYSTDGENWTAAANSTFGDTSSICDIVWGNGKFVAGGGTGGKMAYSTDGVTWTAITSVFR